MQRIILFAAILWSSVAWAQSAGVATSTGDPLLSMCSGVLTESGSGISGKDKLCNCLISQVTAKLTAEEMTAYATANMNSQAPPQGVMDKVTGIATSCLNQAR